jgi:hypothetical protein
MIDPDLLASDLLAGDFVWTPTREQVESIASAAGIEHTDESLTKAHELLSGVAIACSIQVPFYCDDLATAFATAAKSGIDPWQAATLAAAQAADARVKLHLVQMALSGVLQPADLNVGTLTERATIG